MKVYEAPANGNLWWGGLAVVGALGLMLLTWVVSLSMIPEHVRTPAACCPSEPAKPCCSACKSCDCKGECKCPGCPTTFVACECVKPPETEPANPRVQFVSSRKFKFCDNDQNGWEMVYAIRGLRNHSKIRINVSAELYENAKIEQVDDYSQVGVEPTIEHLCNSSTGRKNRAPGEWVGLITSEWSEPEQRLVPIPSPLYISVLLGEKPGRQLTQPGMDDLQVVISNEEYVWPLPSVHFIYPRDERKPIPEPLPTPTPEAPNPQPTAIIATPAKCKPAQRCRPRLRILHRRCR